MQRQAAVQFPVGLAIVTFYWKSWWSANSHINYLWKSAFMTYHPLRESNSQGPRPRMLRLRRSKEDPWITAPQCITVYNIGIFSRFYPWNGSAMVDEMPNERLSYTRCLIHTTMRAEQATSSAPPPVTQAPIRLRQERRGPDQAWMVISRVHESAML